MLLAIVVVAACGGADDEAAPQTFAHYDTKGNREGDAAALIGALEIDTECVYVAVGTSKIVPIFPLSQTSLGDGALVLNERRYLNGADVSFAGGEQTSKPSDAVVPDGCAGDSYWIVAPG